MLTPERGMEDDEEMSPATTVIFSDRAANFFSYLAGLSWDEERKNGRKGVSESFGAENP